MRLKISTLAAVILILFMSSCKNDPKIDPKKDGGDKGDSYSESIELPSLILVD